VSLSGPVLHPTGVFSNLHANDIYPRNSRFLMMLAPPMCQVLQQVAQCGLPELLSAARYQIAERADAL
jgi:hypothetical protein